MTPLLCILVASLLTNLVCACAVLLRTDGRPAFARHQRAMRERE